MDRSAAVRSLVDRREHSRETSSISEDVDDDAAAAVTAAAEPVRVFFLALLLLLLVVVADDVTAVCFSVFPLTRAAISANAAATCTCSHQTHKTCPPCASERVAEASDGGREGESGADGERERERHSALRPVPVDVNG